MEELIFGNIIVVLTMGVVRWGIQSLKDVLHELKIKNEVFIKLFYKSIIYWTSNRGRDVGLSSMG